MSDEADGPATVCPLCAVGCHLRSGESGGRARGAAGPANPNGRLCEMGVTAFDIVGDEGRLEQPLVRRNGTLQSTDWDTAYEEAVGRLETVRAAHGPDALAFLGAPYCTNEENYLLQKLARTLGTNNVDNRARLCHASVAETLSERLGWPASTGSLDSLADAEVILVAGANPAERQPVAFDSFVRPAVNDGAMLVHVDPVGNQTTRLADVHLAPRPGTDALVFALLCAQVSDAGGVDRAFVAERTRGYERFDAALREFDRERAAAVADVERAPLARAAERLADADRVAALTGTGIEGAGRSVPAAEPLLDLLLLTGNVGRRGTGLYIFRGLVNEQGATDAGCAPDRLPGHQPVTDPEARARVTDEWGVAPPSTPGRSARDLLAAFGDEIRGALVVGENPAVSKRDPDWVHDRLAALDALVVLDIGTNETTDRADVVLPAAAGVEKAGTVTNLERRVQRVHPSASTPGAARPDDAILRDIGQRLVDEDSFDYADTGEVFAELCRVAPTHAGVTHREIGREGRQWPFDGDGDLYRDTFDTPDGLGAFSAELPTATPRDASGLWLVTGGRTSEFYGDRDAGDEAVRLHRDDAEDLGIEESDAVAVSAAGRTVEATATVNDSVRKSTVFARASVADPLLRTDARTVAVEPLPDGAGLDRRTGSDTDSDPRQ